MLGEQVVKIEGLCLGHTQLGTSKMSYSVRTVLKYSTATVDESSYKYENCQVSLRGFIGKGAVGYLTSSFFKYTQFLLLTVCVEDKNPKQTIENWLTEIKKQITGKLPPIYVIGTQGDLIASDSDLQEKNSELYRACVCCPDCAYVEYLGISSEKDDWYVDCPWKEGDIKQNMSRGLRDEIGRLAYNSAIKGLKKRETQADSELQEQQQPNLRIREQSFSRLFKIPLKSKCRKSRLAMRLGMSVLVTGGLFPLPLMACALLSYEVERRKSDNSIQRNAYSRM